MRKAAQKTYQRGMSELFKQRLNAKMFHFEGANCFLFNFLQANDDDTKKSEAKFGSTVGMMRKVCCPASSTITQIAFYLSTPPHVNNRKSFVLENPFVLKSSSAFYLRKHELFASPPHNLPEADESEIY